MIDTHCHLEQPDYDKDPAKMPAKLLAKASTIRGAYRSGIFSSLEELPRVDLIVAGSVAVTEDGVRVGKGGGYSEIEYGILRELGLIDEETPVFTTVHDVQIVDRAPKESHDFVVNAIFTPERSVVVEKKYSQPRGIIWEKLTEHQLREMPILQELRRTLNERRQE